MELTEMTPRAAIIAGLRASSKKILFQDLAARLSEVANVPEKNVFTALLERERVGSTGMGCGVAVPHCRLPGVDRIYGCLARLETPIDFEALDGKPVDLVYALVAPDCAGVDHLKALAKISRVLRDEEVRKKLRGARDAEAMFALLQSPVDRKAA